MRISAMLPQEDSVGRSGGCGTRQDIPRDLVQDVRRIPASLWATDGLVAERGRYRRSGMS